MATLTAIQSKRQQTPSGLAFILSYCKQEFKTLYEGRKLAAGVNCLAEDAYREMMNTKQLHHKTDGRMYYHFVQSFSPEENVTPERAHELALRFAAEQFPGYEVLVATHTDKNHLHSHLIVNAVSCETGKKYHSDRDNIERLRAASDRLCREYGLPVLEHTAPAVPQKMSAREYRSADRGESWKLALAVQIENAMQAATDREEFRALMEAEGYSLRWTPERKYITYTCPNGMKCRDSKLHEKKYMKEMMELEFRIRAEIARGIESAAAAGAAGRRRKRPLLCRDGAELEGLADPGTAARRAASDLAEAGAGSDDDGRNEQPDRVADGSAPRFDDGNGSTDGAVSGEAGDGSGSIYERGADGRLGFVETGWERERAVLLRSLRGEREAAAVRPETVRDFSDPGGARAALGAGMGALAAIGSLFDDDSEDEEERRRRREAEQNGADLGAVLGLAVGLIAGAVRRGERQEEQAETDQPEDSLEEKRSTDTNTGGLIMT